MLVLCTNTLSITNNTIISNTSVGTYIYKWILLVIAYQHLKPGTQIFGHLIGEFDSFILIWQIKNKNKIHPTYTFFSEKAMGNKIFLWCLITSSLQFGACDLGFSFLGSGVGADARDLDWPEGWKWARSRPTTQTIWLWKEMTGTTRPWTWGLLPYSHVGPVRYWSPCYHSQLCTWEPWLHAFDEQSECLFRMTALNRWGSTTSSWKTCWTRLIIMSNRYLHGTWPHWDDVGHPPCCL